jgi:hypothetical protein
LIGAAAASASTALSLVNQIAEAQTYVVLAHGLFADGSC